MARNEYESAVSIKSEGFRWFVCREWPITLAQWRIRRA
jgi:hypothetical protein